MKYTTGINPQRPMALRKSKVEIYPEDYDYDNDDDDESISSECLAFYYTYAWVTPRFDDSASDFSSSKRSTRSTREKYASVQQKQQRARPPPPRPAPFAHGVPPPPPPPMGMGMGMDPGMDPGFYDFQGDPGFPDPYMAPPPPPPPPSGGNPGFIDLNAQGGGGGGGAGKPGKYDDWDD